MSKTKLEVLAALREEIALQDEAQGIASIILAIIGKDRPQTKAYAFGDTDEERRAWYEDLCILGDMEVREGTVASLTADLTDGVLNIIGHLVTVRSPDFITMKVIPTVYDKGE